VAETSLNALEQTETKTKDEATRRSQSQKQDQPAAAPPPREKTQREVLQAQLATMQTRYGDEYPEIKKLKAELAGLPPDPPADAAPRPPRITTVPAASNEEAATLVNLSTAIINQRERIAGLQAQLAAANKDFATTSADRMRILKQIDEYQGRIDKIPFREQELATLTRDYETAKDNYKSLLDRKVSSGMAADLERSEEGENFTLIDAAHVPEKPFWPNRQALYAVGVLAGLLVGALIVLGRQLRKDTMLGEWELAPGTVILGRVPRIEMPKTLQVPASSGALT
jgi:uncharacterized protein involved in exopolysaccharide biosynthesis